MPKGHWSFLHEWVIYDYIKARSEEGTLRFKQIFASGKLLGKPKWVKVEGHVLITGTAFPDIQGLKLKGSEISRPAEVKFTTSLFNYHNESKYKEKFDQFISQNGFILVASHDYLPINTLIAAYPNVEVFEIELEDFITFCRENFSRLLNRQIKAHASTRVWIMYQGPNFNIGTDHILPASQSMIWCPTENLTGFDLAPGDRILFYKTSGIATQTLQKRFKDENLIDSKWILNQLYIAEVTSKIFSRSEYHQYKKHTEQKQLWKNDTSEGIEWRWSRVFEFKKVKAININKPMHEIYNNIHSRTFALKAWEAFCFGVSREISLKDYRNLLETFI